MLDGTIVYDHGNASVQLLLTGKFRAINRQGVPKLFDDLAAALAYAK